MLHLQFFGGDTLNTAVIAKGILFQDKVAPFDIQRIPLQHQLFTLGGQQAGTVRGGHHKHGGNQRGNHQNQRDLGVTQQIATNDAN
ncbi:hypothetical protein D3C80_1544300 [compost metagenome]